MFLQSGTWNCKIGYVAIYSIIKHISWTIHVDINVLHKNGIVYTACVCGYSCVVCVHILRRISRVFKQQFSFILIRNLTGDERHYSMCMADCIFWIAVNNIQRYGFYFASWTIAPNPCALLLLHAVHIRCANPELLTSVHPLFKHYIGRYGFSNMHADLVTKKPNSFWSVKQISLFEFQRRGSICQTLVLCFNAEL